MSTAIRLLEIASLTGAGAYAATEVAMHVARATNFLDRPHDDTGYKAHSRPTPYLGGAAVLVAIVAGAVASGYVSQRVLVLIGCAAVLAVLGALDDRFTVAPRWRIAAELGAAVALWAAHIGFTVSSSAAVNLALTALWVVGVVNAFNLTDNMDGACASLTAVSGVGIACFALWRNDLGLAALAVALTAACAGFLPHNLAGPARIFLGDGGSMPLGFLVAGLALATARGRGLGAGELLACGLLAGLPILDTALVSVSRTRRGLTLMTAGRDHLTHRLHSRLHSPRRVVLALVPVQAALAALAVTGAVSGRTLLLGFGLAAVALGVLAVAVLDSPSWRPGEPRRAAASPRETAPRLPAPRAPRFARAPVEAALEAGDARALAMTGTDRLLTAASADLS